MSKTKRPKGQGGKGSRKTAVPAKKPAPPKKKPAPQPRRQAIANPAILKPQDPEEGTLHTIALRKATFIKALSKSLGIASRASLTSGIAIRTHWHWMNTDPEYAQAVRDVKVIMKDFIEESLMDLIKDKNPAAIIFAAKTQLKDRGYIETVHQMTQTFDDNNVTIFEIPDNGRDQIEDAKLIEP